MTDVGIERFYSDMGINAETDLMVLLISKYMGAENMGEYTRKQFEQGC